MTALLLLGICAAAAGAALLLGSKDDLGRFQFLRWTIIAPSAIGLVLLPIVTKVRLSSPYYEPYAPGHWREMLFYMVALAMALLAGIAWLHTEAWRTISYLFIGSWIVLVLRIVLFPQCPICRKRCDYDW